MKNTMLWGALFTLICSQVQADMTQQANQPQTPNSIAMPTAQPNGSAKQTSQAIPQVQTVIINCEYKIPAETKITDRSLIITWSEKAAVQAFDFDPINIDAQLQKLQACFTEQGWIGFDSALQKSGNIDAIKSQKLTISSQVDGITKVTEVKENQWKITLPLKVVYQNEKEKVTQLLNINLTIGRKINGDLGIMQMISSQRPATKATPKKTFNH